MFTISLPTNYKVGDTRDCRVDGNPTTVTWRDKDTLVIGDNDARQIVDILQMPGRNLNTFICADKDGSTDFFIIGA